MTEITGTDALARTTARSSADPGATTAAAGATARWLARPSLALTRTKPASATGSSRRGCRLLQRYAGVAPRTRRGCLSPAPSAAADA
ncbi:hypothetical protein [Microbacterium lacticum]